MSSKVSDAAVIDQYLEPDPVDPDPAAWRLKERAVPVWAIIGSLTDDGENAEQVAADFGVSAAAVAAALVYYHHHSCVIDARLAANVA